MEKLCALCGFEKPLKKSHLIPRAAYRYVRDRKEDGGRSPMRVHLSSSVAYHTDEQVKRDLLCDDCEQLFSKHGENDVARMWATHTDFPLLEKAKSLPVISGPRFSMVQPGSISTETLKRLYYFAISVVWRSHRWDWGKYPSPHRGSLGDRYDKVFSAYLNGRGSEISGVRLIVTINTNPELNAMLSFPYVVKRNGCGFHRFDVLGLHFCLLVGRHIGSALSLPFDKASSNTILLLRDMTTAAELQDLARDFCSTFPDK